MINKFHINTFKIKVYMNSSSININTKTVDNSTLPSINLINELPLEIIFHIFSFLSLKDLQAVHAVSSNWKVLTLDFFCRHFSDLNGQIEKFYMETDLSPKSLSTKTKNDLIKIFKNNYLENLKNLEAVNCSFSKYFYKYKESIATILKDCKYELPDILEIYKKKTSNNNLQDILNETIIHAKIFRIKELKSSTKFDSERSLCDEISLLTEIGNYETALEKISLIPEFIHKENSFNNIISSLKVKKNGSELFDPNFSWKRKEQLLIKISEKITELYKQSSAEDPLFYFFLKKDTLRNTLFSMAHELLKMKCLDTAFKVGEMGDCI